MKERTIYICEKCGLEIIDDYQRMIDHEHDNHTEPSSFQDPEAGSFYDTKDGYRGLYPRTVTVKMQNGAKVQYSGPVIVEGHVEPIESSPAIGSSQESLKEEPFTF